MQLTVSYREIQNYILREYKKEIGLEYIDRQTFRVSYSPSRFVPTARLNIRVDFVSEEEVILSYNGRRGINMIIHGLVLCMGNRIDSNLLRVVPEDRLLYFYPLSVKGAAKVFELLKPEGIYFTETGVEVVMGLR